MGDINPLTSGTGWIGPSRNRFLLDPNGGATATPLTTNKPLHPARFKNRAIYFADIDNADDWKDQRGVVASAWQANTTSDPCGTFVRGASIRAHNNGNIDGWIHMFYGGNFKFTDAANDETPAAKGSPGYCPPGTIFMNHKSDTPNTLTGGRRVNTSSLRFQVFPVTLTGDATDRWKCTTGTRGTDILCPGIVAIAWQCEAPNTDNTDWVAATLDAAGDVILTSFNADVTTGWLWVWRKR